MTQYCTTKQVFEYLNWIKEQPEFVSGQTPTLEEVDTSGTLANGSVIYLDHNRVIDNTLVLSYGASAASVTTLTITTDYTIDLDKAKITITTAGATAIGANSVYAEYGYSEIDNRPGINDSYISTLIDRAVALFDNEMNRSFQASVLVTREERVGKGRFARRYLPRQLPVLDVKMTLTTTVTDSDTTFVVNDTTGLTASDYITIGQEVASIDSVDSSTNLTVTRGALSSTAAAHTSGVFLVNVAVEVSTTPIGSTPTYRFLSYPEDFDIDSDTSYITFLHNDITADGLFLGQYPEKNVPNRVRLSYNYGTSSVPSDIEMACISQVSRWLVSSSIAKGLSEGQDGFTPTAQEVLSEDILMILKQHKLLLADYS